MIKKLTSRKTLSESLSNSDRAQIIEYAAMGFETGHHLFEPDDFADFKREETEIKDKKAAWDFYWDCINMGPAGFYEEFCDEYDFSDDYKAEYGYEESLNPGASIKEAYNPGLESFLNSKIITVDSVTGIDPNCMKRSLMPRGCYFKSSCLLGGRVVDHGTISWKGTDYVFRVKSDGQLVVMTETQAGSNWSETIFKENSNLDLDQEYSKEQVEADIKRLTYNFTVDHDIIKCGYAGEQDYAYDILSQYYKNIKRYKSGYWYVIKFDTLIAKEV